MHPSTWIMGPKSVPGDCEFGLFSMVAILNILQRQGISGDLESNQCSHQSPAQCCRYYSECYGKCCNIFKGISDPGNDFQLLRKEIDVGVHSELDGRLNLPHSLDLVDPTPPKYPSISRGKYFGQHTICCDAIYPTQC